MCACSDGSFEIYLVFAKPELSSVAQSGICSSGFAEPGVLTRSFLLKCRVQWCHLHQSYSFLNKYFIDKQNCELIDHFFDAKDVSYILQFLAHLRASKQRKRKNFISLVCDQICAKLTQRYFEQVYLLLCK